MSRGNLDRHFKTSPESVKFDTVRPMGKTTRLNLQLNRICKNQVVINTETEQLIVVIITPTKYDKAG